MPSRTRRPPTVIGATRFVWHTLATAGRWRRETFETSDGSRLAVYIAGPQRGAPVLLLHGYCGDSAQMRAVARRLMRDRQVILYDARGHGSSDGFSGRPTMAQLGRDLAEILDHYAPTGAGAIGLSMGAQTIFELLSKRPDARLQRLVFIDQSPKILSDDTWSHGLFGALDPEDVAQVRADLRARPRRLGRAWLRGMWRSEEHTAIKALLSPGMAMGLRGVPEDTLRLADDMLNQDWRATVRAITQPVLLLYGGRSIYPRAGRWMAEAIPHAHLEYFDHSGHALIFEEIDRASAAVRSFFALAGPGASAHP